MADVITRFRLETTQYDSKLRDAAKGLKEIARQAELGGKDFTQFSQKSVDAARSLGQTASGATNTKDKLKDLVGAFNDTAKAFNNLSAAQQQSDFGKALSQSLEQLHQRIRQTKDELYNLGSAVDSKSGGLFSGDKFSGMLQVFGGNVMTKLAGVGVGFASEMKDMVAQGIELAKQGEGIRIAFERLGRGDILQGLREATHGTVTDLELMKAAVKFNDFKLPLDELGTMLAFAQQKAKDTGQSVDYMVDSIVTGLGRKSLMILDNLGLSAAQIKEKMAETGDMTKAVGAIIREEMAKAGDYVETAADRATQANVSLQNKMEELGRKFAPLEEASNTFWTSVKISILDVVGGPLAQFLNGLTEAGRLQNALNNAKNSDRVTGDINKLKGSNFKPQAYQMMLEKYSREEQKALNNWRKSQRGGMGSQAIWENRYNEARALREEFQRRGNLVVNPTPKETTTPTTTTTTTTTTTNTGSNPTKQAADKVAAAHHEYAQSIEQAKMSLENGTKTEADYKKQLLSAEERLWNALGDAYNTHADPKYKQAQDECAAKIKQLGGEVTASIEAQKKAQEAARQLEQAQKKLAEAQQELATAKQSGNLKDIYKAQEKVTSAQKDVTRLETLTQVVNVVPGTIELPTIPEQEIPLTIPATTQNLDAFIGNLKQQLSQAELGSELYNNLTAQLADANALGNLMQTAIKNGIDVAEFNPQELWSKIFGDNPGDYISNEDWQKKLGVISQKTGKKLQFNPQTGEIREGKNKGSDDLQEFSKDFSTITGSVNGILSGIQNLGVEIPDGLAKTIGVIQTISGILTAILAITTAIQATSSANAAANWLDAIFPFARGGIVKAFSGTLVGNTYSGDQLRGIDQSGQLYGLNAGEVVLNRAQVGNLASSLSGGMQNMQLSAIITGEQLRLVLNNNGRRTGRGEYVTTNFR